MAHLGEFEIFLADCTNVLLREIAEPKARQKDIALTYRMAIDAAHGNGEPVDWLRVNEAIVARWGAKGRERIKTAAWKIGEAPAKPRG